MVRVLALAFVAAGCGPAGDVTVHVRSNAAFGETPIPPLPIEGAYVFADREAVRTDAEGNATLEVYDAPATVHVLAPGPGNGDTVYTFVDVPVDAAISVGGRPLPALTEGTMQIDFPAIAGATYSVRAPTACIREGAVSATSTVFVMFNAGCAGTSVHAFGLAITAAGTQYIEADLVIEAGGQLALQGPYADASAYMLEIANLPDTGSPAVVQLGTIDGSAVTTLAAPATADGAIVAIDAPPADALVVRQRASTWIALGLPQPGANVIDATPMLPIPGDAVFEGDRATWSYDAGTRDLDGMVLETDVLGAAIHWIVHGGATSTTARFPSLPSDAGVDPGSGELSPASTIVFYSVAGERPFDVDASYLEWLEARALPAGDLAITGRF